MKNAKKDKGLPKTKTSGYLYPFKTHGGTIRGGKTLSQQQRDMFRDGSWDIEEAKIYGGAKRL